MVHDKIALMTTPLASLPSDPKLKAPKLAQKIPDFSNYSEDLILSRFLEYCAECKLELYPAQEEAILELIGGKNIILNTPTGSGKSLVATALHFISMSQGQKSVYTSPIKALVNEKFFSLVKEFGAMNVGLMTGDSTVNRDAPLICCTAEILANLALREGDRAKVQDIIMDEFHFYSDRERGQAWQIPLLSMPQARFLLMSATLGDMDFFEKELTKLNGRETLTVHSAHRPVPLDFDYRETPLHETIASLLSERLSPVYLVAFSQRQAAEEAQKLLSIDFLSKEEKKLIQEKLRAVSFRSPFGKTLERLLKHGVGLHHAGLLPRYRLIVENLAQQGLLRVVCGTDTLGVGINIPIRTVLFSQLCKYDGEKTSILSIRDFHQISGRAGRKGFDDRGRVVAQAPPHVIENIKMEQKGKDDPKRAKKQVRAKPPEKGFVMWTKATFDKLIASKPEALLSRFSMSNALMLNVFARSKIDPAADVCDELAQLIRKSHETPHAKKLLRKTGWQYFRALLSRDIVRISEQKVSIAVELQDDFSLNQSLSLYLIDSIAALEPGSPTWHLDVLSLVESIAENPDTILNRLRDAAKTVAMQEMKAAGMDYDQRIEELEKIDYPKPLADFIYPTFRLFVEKHPWLAAENIRPKSIARDMYERYATFGEYTKEYGIERSEGVFLRYLTDVYKMLAQTVAEKSKTEAFLDMEVFFHQVIQLTDSSLLDEWERLRGQQEGLSSAELDQRAQDLLRIEGDRVRTQDEKMRVQTLRRKMSAEAHFFLRELGLGLFDDAVERIQSWPNNLSTEASPWTASKLEEKMRAFVSDGRRMRLDGKSRLSEFSRWQGPLEESRDQAGPWYSLELTACDDQDANDWTLTIEGRLDGSMVLRRFDALT